MFIPPRIEIDSAWKSAWASRSFRLQFIVTMVAVLSFTMVFRGFFDFVESRSGTALSDPVLDLLPPTDVSWTVFFFLYTGIVIGLLTHLSHPKVVLLSFQTYVIVTLMRMCTITLLPLEPPEGYIPLKEPFVQLFTTGGKIISKDLFFSGHVSTILSLFFATHIRPVRAFLFICALMIGFGVMLQHVHYTIDVLFALPATWGIYLFCKKFLGGRSYYTSTGQVL